MSETSDTGSAAERRRIRGAALVGRHPRWHGITHPELIALPPRRLSSLDMLPVIEAERFRRLEHWCGRAERNRQILAEHPRWRGIRHPERLCFPEIASEAESRRAYWAALRHAQSRLDESKELYARIAAVADGLDRVRWPWGATPDELSPLTAEPPWSRPRLPASLRSRRPIRPRPRPTPRLLTH